MSSNFDNFCTDFWWKEERLCVCVCGGGGGGGGGEEGP